MNVGTLGIDRARRLGHLYEFGGIRNKGEPRFNSAPDRLMDLRNNELGFDFAVKFNITDRHRLQHRIDIYDSNFRQGLNNGGIDTQIINIKF